MTEVHNPPAWHRPAKRGRKASRHPLTTLPGCIGEIAHVYRAFKRGSITAEVARTRTYILDKLRAGLEAQTLADLENRLDEAEANGRVDDDHGSAEPAVLAH
jgi:hypothetical protein